MMFIDNMLLNGILGTLFIERSSSMVDLGKVDLDTVFGVSDNNNVTGFGGILKNTKLSINGGQQQGDINRVKDFIEAPNEGHTSSKGQFRSRVIDSLPADNQDSRQLFIEQYVNDAINMIYNSWRVDRNINVYAEVSKVMSHVDFLVEALGEE